VPQEYRDLLFDPQTSGGLLNFHCREGRRRRSCGLQRRGAAARIVGSVHNKKSPLIHVTEAMLQSKRVVTAKTPLSNYGYHHNGIAARSSAKLSALETHASAEADEPRTNHYLGIDARPIFPDSDVCAIFSLATTC